MNRQWTIDRISNQIEDATFKTERENQYSSIVSEDVSMLRQQSIGIIIEMLTISILHISNVQMLVLIWLLYESAKNMQDKAETAIH